jgi:hypothetical protein
MRRLHAGGPGFRPWAPQASPHPLAAPRPHCALQDNPDGVWEVIRHEGLA